jgi:hypothetical protein
MSGTSPDFNYWSTRPTLQVWFVAAMMHGVDPRAMADVTDANGDALDISDDIQLLISASLVGAIEAYPLAGHNPDKHTELSKARLETWLRTRGYADLADGLFGAPLLPPQVTNPPTQPVSHQASPGFTSVPRFTAQENEILAAIKTLGHNPLQLPENKAGKSGVKAQIKAKLGKSGYWSGTTVFSRAWERMRASEMIANKK